MCAVLTAIASCACISTTVYTLHRRQSQQSRRSLCRRNFNISFFFTRIFPFDLPSLRAGACRLSEIHLESNRSACSAPSFGIKSHYFSFTKCNCIKLSNNRGSRASERLPTRSKQKGGNGRSAEWVLLIVILRFNESKA